MPDKPQKSAKSIRESALEHLAGEYKDALQLTNELKRAIDSFSGEISPVSPFRYLRTPIGEAINDVLDREGKPKTIKQLTMALEAGSCIFGSTKTPEDMVSKVVAGYVQHKLLKWMDARKTLVGLPAWKRK